MIWNELRLSYITEDEDSALLDRQTPVEKKRCLKDLTGVVTKF